MISPAPVMETFSAFAQAMRHFLDFSGATASKPGSVKSSYASGVSYPWMRDPAGMFSSTLLLK